LDIYLEFDDSAHLSTNIYDKQNDFNFEIINFSNMCSNIPASPAYGVFTDVNIMHKWLKDWKCQYYAQVEKRLNMSILCTSGLH
jgi:hypothetical protein